MGEIAPAKIERAELAARALALRKAGYSYDQIAEETGADPKRIHGAIRSALRKYYPPHEIKALRALLESRYDDLLQAIWPKAMSAEPQAIGIVLTILRDMRAMLGTDEPAQVSVKGKHDHEHQHRVVFEFNLGGEPEKLIEGEAQPAVEQIADESQRPSSD